MKYVIGSQCIGYFHPPHLRKRVIFCFLAKCPSLHRKMRAVNRLGLQPMFKRLKRVVCSFCPDKSVSIPVIYQGQLPQEFEDGNPAIVLGEFDGTVLFANAIIVQFFRKTFAGSS